MKKTGILLFLICAIQYLDAQNPGEIIFSSSPIDPASPAGLKHEFVTGDHLYAVAYLPQTLKQIYTNAGPVKNFDIEIFIYEIKPPLYSYQQPSEEQLTFTNMWVSAGLKEQKFLVADIVPDPETTVAYTSPDFTYKEFGKKFEGPVNFAEALAKLGPGEHTLKVVVKCYYNDAASGTLKISGNDFSIYGKTAEALNNTAMNAGAKNAILPKAGKSDLVLEKQMIAAFKGSNDWKSGFIDATEVLKLVIIDNDWYVKRHEISGAILHRYIRAAIAVKTKSGKCAYYNLVTFQEDYTGGRFQPLKYDGTGDQVMMECANLNK
jgi:hypothetical protein